VDSGGSVQNQKKDWGKNGQSGKRGNDGRQKSHGGNNRIHQANNKARSGRRPPDKKPLCLGVCSDDCDVQLRGVTIEPGEGRGGEKVTRSRHREGKVRGRGRIGDVDKKDWKGGPRGKNRQIHRFWGREVRT